MMILFNVWQKYSIQMLRPEIVNHLQKPSANMNIFKTVVFRRCPSIQKCFESICGHQLCGDIETSTIDINMIQLYSNWIYAGSINTTTLFYHV